MTSAGAIVELMRTNLFDVFSERDAERRLAVIRRHYTPDVLWSDPEGVVRGHEELNLRAQRLLDRSPGFVFTATGAAVVSFDLGYLPFAFGPPDSEPAATGVDVALVRGGQIAQLYTLVLSGT
jgi:SnoaL-like domain